MRGDTEEMGSAADRVDARKKSEVVFRMMSIAADRDWSGWRKSRKWELSVFIKLDGGAVGGGA